MSDLGHEKTDAILAALGKRISKEYKIAEKEVKAKLDDYLRRFKKKDEKWQEWVQEGKKTKEQYNQWLTGQIAIGRRWEETRETIAEDYHNANVIAKAIIDNQMLDVYALNHNYGTYEVETGAQVDTDYTLYDRDTVKRILDDGKELYHAPGKKLAKKIAENKDIRWNKQQIQSVMVQSILQGESIPTIATRLADTVGESNRAVAIRNARTMTTGVENAGRQDSYKRAQDLGIEMEKQWIATLDGRTRHSHRFLDGQVVAVNGVFSNGCEFPGDPEGDPAEIYNCRCTMISQVKGFETDVSDLSLRHDANLEGMTYEEWKAQKKTKSNPITLPEEKARNIKNAYIAEYRGKGTNGRKSGGNDDKTVPKEHTEEYNRLKTWMEKDGVKHVPVNDLKKQLTRQEIIDKIAGGDMTKGSCASLALSYCGNVAGMDVTDFRGGSSQEEFANNSTIENMLKIANADIKKYKVKKEAKETAEILKGLDVGKEYLLSAGHHCAIVRNTGEHGPEYLELQSGKINGWEPFATEKRSVAGGLIDRFRCKKTVNKHKNALTGKNDVYERPVLLADVETFKKNDEIQEMFGYINTEAGKQKKGVKGVTK